MTGWPKPVGFLGPAHTFSERAVSAFAAPGDRVDYGRIEDALPGLEAGRFQAVLMPFESSAAGPVPSTLQALVASAAPLRVAAVHDEPVRFGLYRRRDDGAPLSRVVGHPMALKQCADWIEARRLATAAAASNGAAFAGVRDGGSAGDAALAPAGIDEPLMIEAFSDPQGEHANTTRFLLLDRAGAPGRLTRALVQLAGRAPADIQASVTRLEAEGAPDGLAILELATPVYAGEIERRFGRLLLYWRNRATLG